MLSLRAQLLIATTDEIPRPGAVPIYNVSEQHKNRHQHQLLSQHTRKIPNSNLNEL